MTRKSFYSWFGLLLAPLFRLAELFIRNVAPVFDPTAYRTPALVAVASPALAAVRSYWSRITARSDDPVPRTV